MLCSSANYSCTFLFRHDGGFTDTQTVLLHLQASGNNSVVKSQAPVISACEIHPSHSHSRYSRVQTKKKPKKKKQGNVHKKERKQKLVVSERAHSFTDSTTCSSTLIPHWRGICDVPYEGSPPPEGWNGLSELTGSQLCGQGQVGLCSAYSWTPSSLCGLGPAAVHQTAHSFAGDDAFCWLQEPLQTGCIDFTRRRPPGHCISLSMAVCAWRHRVVLR